MEIPLNLKKDIPDSRDYVLKTILREDPQLSLPLVVDWTQDMSKVKDQGRLGSCVGFAVAAMKECQEKREHLKELAEGKRYRRPTDKWDLSEAWIYWNCKKIDPWPNEEGTSIRCAMDVLRKIGVPCEKGYKYSDVYKGTPEDWASLIARWGLIESYWRVDDLGDVRLALQQGPFVAGVACFNEIFYVGTNGVVPMPSNPNNVLGGHAICVVGYDDNSRLVKFKNSWSESWGKKGYGFLHYDYINQFMWDAWAAKDLSVTKDMLKGKRSLV
jgi:C1A family cysteine protease